MLCRELREVQVGGRPLTPPETRILRLLARGMTAGEIAAKTGMNEHTIKSHIKTARAKLYANNITHAVAVAITEDMI